MILGHMTNVLWMIEPGKPLTDLKSHSTEETTTRKVILLKSWFLNSNDKRIEVVWNNRSTCPSIRNCEATRERSQKFGSIDSTEVRSNLLSLLYNMIDLAGTISCKSTVNHMEIFSENNQVFIEAKNRVPLSPPREPKQNRFFKLPRTTKATIFAHATVTESDVAPTYLNTEYSEHSITDLMTTLETKPRRKATTTTTTTTKRTTTTKPTTTTTTTTSINWTRNGLLFIQTNKLMKLVF